MTKDQPEDAAGDPDEGSEAAQPPVEVAEVPEVVETGESEPQSGAGVSVKMVHRQAPLSAPSELGGVLRHLRIRREHYRRDGPRHRQASSSDGAPVVLGGCGSHPLRHGGDAGGRVRCCASGRGVGTWRRAHSAGQPDRSALGAAVPIVETAAPAAYRREGRASARRWRRHRRLAPRRPSCLGARARPG